MKVIRVNKGFLYTKPIVPGIIDDTPMDMDSWFLDDSREVLKEKFTNANLEQVILELVQIFREGNPNYQVLIGMFDSELGKEVKGSEVFYQLFDIRRNTKGINTIELYVDSVSLGISSFNIDTEENLD